MDGQVVDKVDGHLEASLPIVSQHELKDQSEKQQHDLEKLQEAHDRLLHEIEEKRNFAEKLHVQLDCALGQSEEIRVIVAEKENDIKHLEAKVAEKDALIEKYKESETQIPKLKALAVKLKKQLAEAKEELDRKSAPHTPVVDPSKHLSAEVDRLSSLYHNSVKNFQALQSEFDKLQDEYEQLLERKKRSDGDLNQSITELNKLRVSVAELKHENENLSRRVHDLENESEINFNKRKEMESKVIVAQKELSEERKKLVNQTGLEMTLAEIKKQLDLKTSEIVELSDVLEKQKRVQEENSEMRGRIGELESQVRQLESENEETKEVNWNLSRKIESINSANEQDKIRLVDLVTDNKKISRELVSCRDHYKRRQIELEQKLNDCEKKLEDSREELEFKVSEFEDYKSKVFKVLNENQSSHLEVHELKITNQDLQLKLASCQARVESLLHDLEKLKSDCDGSISELERSKVLLIRTEGSLKEQLEESRREIICLKCQNRELQNQLATAKARIEEESSFRRELDVVSLKLEDIQNEKQRLEKELKAALAAKDPLQPVSESTTLTPEHVGLNSGHPSPKSTDDVDSIGSTSLSSRAKRLSISSISDTALGASNNVLQELMNLRFDEEDGTDLDRMTETGEVGEVTKIGRFTELLEESEAANALLTEQNRVLKEEIRRLERAMSRIELAQNLEYLKNLLVKYSSLQDGSSEKIQLVSVLKTILKLSEEEESILVKDATKTEQPPQNTTNSWSSYIWN